MSVFRKILFAKSVFALLASQQIVAQTVHYAINDSGANEIGIQSTPGAGCTLPFDGDGGSFVNAYAGDEPQTEKTHTWFGIFSFNTEGEGWVAGGTYQLFIQERDREGTPFQDLGKMLIEYTDNDEPFPDRFGQAGNLPGQAMNLLGSFTESEFFAVEGIDISDTVNQVLAAPHAKYLYLRFRFENCEDGDQESDRTRVVTGGTANPDNSVRIIVSQDSGVNKLYFAQFGDGAEGEANLFSQISLLNVSTERQATVRILLRNGQGQPLQVDLNGEVVAGELQTVIPAGALRRFATDGQGMLQAGTVTVCSDEPLEGVILFGGSVGLAGVASSSVLTSGLIAPVETNTAGRVNTGVALMNLEDQQVTVQLQLCDEDRNVLATAQVMLAFLAQLPRFVTQLEWDTPPDFTSFSGLLKATFEGRIAATVIQTRGKQFATMPVANPAQPLTGD